MAKKEIYRLTPKGLLGDENNDRLIKYLKNIRENAIILEKGILSWGKVLKDTEE